jgi:hypothetical protein
VYLYFPDSSQQTEPLILLANMETNLAQGDVEATKRGMLRTADPPLKRPRQCEVGQGWQDDMDSKDNEDQII